MGRSFGAIAWNEYAALGLCPPRRIPSSPARSERDGPGCYELLQIHGNRVQLYASEALFRSAFGPEAAACIFHALAQGRNFGQYSSSTKAFLEAEGVLTQGMIVNFLCKEGYLTGYTTSPIIISRSYVWIPDATARWKAMSHRVLGPSCKPVLVVEYQDED